MGDAACWSHLVCSACRRVDDDLDDEAICSTCRQQDVPGADDATEMTGSTVDGGRSEDRPDIRTT